MRQDRRRFCRTVLGLATLGALASTLAPLRHPRAMGDDLAALLRHPASARRVGERVLASNVAEPGAALRLGLAAGPDRDARRSAVRDQAARDYAAGDVVLVDGWVLSRTEAQLCALVALT